MTQKTNFYSLFFHGDRPSPTQIASKLNINNFQKLTLSAEFSLYLKAFKQRILSLIVNRRLRFQGLISFTFRCLSGKFISYAFLDGLT